jgi:hypothetical protein
MATVGRSDGTYPIEVVILAERSSFECPYCTSSYVDRLFLASLNLDTCACLACGARWDEDATTGEFRGRAATGSMVGHDWGTGRSG